MGFQQRSNMQLVEIYFKTPYYFQIILCLQRRACVVTCFVIDGQCGIISNKQGQ